MIRRLAWMPAAALAGCVSLPPRTEILSRTGHFKAQVAAVAVLSGVQERDFQVARALARVAPAAGMRAFSLLETDVLRGAPLTPDVLADPRALAEIRQATGAEAVVLLTLEDDWSSFQLTVIDARTGDAVLRAALKPRGKAFAGADDAARAAVPALSEVSAAPPSTSLGEDIPVP